MLKLKSYVLALSILVLLFGHIAQTKTVSSATKRTFIGSWIVTGTPDPATGVPSFVNVSTNSSSGNIINVDPLDGVGVGQWKKKGNSYSVTFRGFTKIDKQSYVYKVRGEVVLSQDGKTFDGPFVTEIFDADGNVMFTVPGTVHGVRFSAEKL